MTDCVHVWEVDQQDKGVCRKCGLHKDFAKAQKEAGWPYRLYKARRLRG